MAAAPRRAPSERVYWQGHRLFQDVSEDLAATIKRVELAAGQVLDLQKTVKACLSFSKQVVAKCQKFAHFYYMVASTVTQSGKRLRDINDQMISDWTRWKAQHNHTQNDLVAIEMKGWPDIIKRTHGDLLIFQDLDIRVDPKHFAEFIAHSLVINVRGAPVEDCNPEPATLRQRRQMVREFQQLFNNLQEAEASSIGGGGGGAVLPIVPTEDKGVQVNTKLKVVISPKKARRWSSDQEEDRQVKRRAPSPVQRTSRALNTSPVRQRHQGSQTMIVKPASPPRYQQQQQPQPLPRQQMSFGRPPAIQYIKQQPPNPPPELMYIPEREQDLRTSAASMVSALPSEPPAIQVKQAAVAPHPVEVPCIEPPRSMTPRGRELPPICSTPRLNPPEIRFLPSAGSKRAPPLTRSGSVPTFLLKQPNVHLIQPTPGGTGLSLYDDTTKQIRILHLQTPLPERFGLTMLPGRPCAVIAGGLQSGRALDTSYSISPSGHIAHYQSFLLPRFDLSLTSDGHSTVYLTGGLGLTHTLPAFLDSLCVLDVLTERWRSGFPRLNVPRAQHASALFNRKSIYVFGGISLSSILPIERLKLDSYSMEWARMPLDVNSCHFASAIPLAAQTTKNQILVFAADSSTLFTVTPKKDELSVRKIRLDNCPGVWGGATATAVIEGRLCLLDRDSVLWGLWEGRWRQRRLQTT